MDDKINNDLVSKVYGDYNALAINMCVGCDCDPEVKQAIVMDWLGYHPKPYDKQFFVIDYLDCLKPDKTI